MSGEDRLKVNGIRALTEAETRLVGAVQDIEELATNLRSARSGRQFVEADAVADSIESVLRFWAVGVGGVSDE